MMKKLKLTIATCALLVGGATGFAMAQGPGHGGGGGKRAAMKEKFDLNKDGTLDAGEKAKMKDAFIAKRAAKKAEVLAKFDANRNGTLDPAEKQAMHDARAAARFAKLDANGDGVISLAEFKAGKQGHHRGKRGRGGGMGGGMKGGL